LAKTSDSLTYGEMCCGEFHIMDVDFWLRIKKTEYKMISDFSRNQSTRKNFRGPGTEISDMEREEK